MRGSDGLALGSIVFGAAVGVLLTHTVSALVWLSDPLAGVVVAPEPPSVVLESPTEPLPPAPDMARLIVRSADPEREAEFELMLTSYAEGESTRARTPFTLTSPRQHLDGVLANLEGEPEIFVQLRPGVGGWPEAFGPTSVGSDVWIAASGESLSTGTLPKPVR